MIVPWQQDDALLLDVAVRDVQDGHVHLWWLGQSGFLVQYEGAHLLLDPYLSDSLTRKYAGTDKPHIRMTERVIDPARLDFIDVVTSSHTHTDHLDAETLNPLRHANPDLQLVIAEANRAAVVERLGCDPAWPLGLDIGASLEVGPFRLEAVPAAHETLDPQYVGYVVHCGPWRLYHSGDTVRFDGMAERLATLAVDVAILPINGRAPERRVAGNLDAHEAVALARDIGARTVVPCHYEMFTFNTADPSVFVQACAAIDQRADVLRCGEGWSTASLGPPQARQLLS